MSPGSPRGLLPTKIRLVLMATLATGLIVSWQAAQEFGLALSSSSLSLPNFNLSNWPFAASDAKAMTQALEAAWYAQINAINGMRTTRMPILLGLAGSASLVFVSAMRLRWPFGAPRLHSLRILQRATVAVFLFRTLEAAQAVVIARSGAEAMIRHLPQPIAFLPTLMGFLSAAQAFFVLGLFFVFLKYLSSERVVQSLKTADEQGPSLDE
jgi:hypothetical protein